MPENHLRAARVTREEILRKEFEGSYNATLVLYEVFNDEHVRERVRK